MPTGADAKIAVQELLTQDNVDILAGWIHSPNAIAAAPIVTAGKKLGHHHERRHRAHHHHVAVLSAHVRSACGTPAMRFGEAAAKQLKAKTAVVGYTDFPPGKDSLDAFKRSFEANGGKVIDEIPMGGAGAVPDLTPFFQRAKDKKPDVFFVFVPAGDHARGGDQDLWRARHAAGRHQADRPGRPHRGHQAAVDGRRRGRPDHHAPLPRRSRQSREQALRGRLEEGIWRELQRQTSWRSSGYDGMAAIAHVVQTLKGKIDTDKALAALKGWKFNSPRGPIMIDPDTRDIVMNEYLSEVVKGKDGRLLQKVIGKIENVKDAVQGVQKIGPCAGSFRPERFALAGAGRSASAALCECAETPRLARAALLATALALSPVVLRPENRGAPEGVGSFTPREEFR